MDILAPILGGLASSIGGAIFGNKANAADQQAQQQADVQNQIVQYLINRRRNVYDPLIDQQVIPALSQRMSAGPSFAGLAEKNIKRLSAPVALNY
jgi:hypothetical protein